MSTKDKDNDRTMVKYAKTAERIAMKPGFKPGKGLGGGWGTCTV